MDEKIIAVAARVPTTNVSPQRHFAILDHLLREKPNAHTFALGAIIMFVHNKTAVWLEKLDNIEEKNYSKQHEHYRVSRLNLNLEDRKYVY